MTRTAPTNAIKTMNDGSKCVCIKTELVSRDLAHTDFDLTDARGRKVGSHVIHVIVTVTARDADSKGYEIMDIEQFEALNACGTRYGYELQATRDGESFGSCNHTKWFDDVIEMHAASAKALENSRKRAAKQFG